MLIQGENKENGCFPGLPYFHGIGCLGMGPLSGIWEKDLLVDHSNVLKPMTVLQSTWPRWFYMLIV